MITYQDSGTQVVEKDKNTSENSLEERVTALVE